jgi:hypothetical protein
MRKHAAAEAGQALAALETKHGPVTRQAYKDGPSSPKDGPRESQGQGKANVDVRLWLVLLS